MTMRGSRALLYLIFTFTVILGLAWPYLPVSDKLSYLNFADKRGFFGISNAFDVLSNLAFLLVGFYGVFLLHQNRGWPVAYRVVTWMLVIGTIFTAFGSAFFHLKPSIARLFWDRLPMTLAFAGTIGIFIVDRIGEKRGLLWACLLMPLAMLTVVGWSINWLTLRPYIALQFGGLIFVILLGAIQPKGRIPNSTLWLSFGFYALAKALEFFDAPIYGLGGVVSGHTLKHLVAAISVWKVLSFLKLRYERLGF